jgi:hypothetical protein
MSIKKLGKYDFTIRRGDTVRKPFQFGGAGFEPTDITGFDAFFVVVDCDDPETVLLEATTLNGKVIVDGPSLVVTLLLTDAETDALTWDKGTYTLRLKDTPGTGDALTYITGVNCVIGG